MVVERWNFSNVKFNEVDFLAVRFSGRANFSKVEIKQKGNFSESKIKEGIFYDSKLNNVQFLELILREEILGYQKLTIPTFLGQFLKKKLFIFCRNGEKMNF